MQPRAIIVLIAMVLVCVGVGALGSLATADSVATWYQTIEKPSWTPPSWLFGPVWTLLYILMGIAAWLVWRRGGVKQQRAPLALFTLQLILNGAWSFIFFGAQRPGLAAIEIVALLLAIIATTIAFFRARPAAGWLMTPYLAWVCFATALNIAIWRLNAG